ncbi:hypothetical protein [Pseudomonas sp. HMSC75E02]|uniref:hypothetical protein n=1 Tax=Pseudomonas sp. HMSC75E02 TaxID=1608908 RepID=UPI00114D3D5E|nr:hypothetical protein [Pseudomonas sp. HMSC75E02]
MIEFDISSELLGKLQEQIIGQVIPVTFLLAGWFLARAADSFRESRRIKKLCKLIESELSQLKDELELLLIKLERGIQIASRQGIEPAIHLPIEAHIYNNYYKDAVLGLNKRKRISIQLIHTTIKHINDSASKMEETIREVHTANDEEEFLSIQQQWKESQLACYYNAANAIWHIKLHLGEPNGPDLSPGTNMHRDFLKYNASVRSHIEDLIEKSKNISLEKFEEIYDEASFSNAFAK